MEHVSLQQSIKKAYDLERWSEVVELVSQTNWRKKPLEPVEAIALVEALLNLSGKEKFAYDYAKLFFDFYGNISERKNFQGVMARFCILEGDKFKSAGQLNKSLESYQLAVQNLAHDPETMEKIKQLIQVTKEEINNEIQQKAFEERERFRISEEIKAKREKEEALRKEYMSKIIKDVGGLSPSIIKKLEDSGIVTFGDLAKAGDHKIDTIQGIGEVALKQIKAYKVQYNL